MRIVFAPCVTHTQWEKESEITQFRRFARSIWHHAGAVSYILTPTNMSDREKIKDEEPYLYNVLTGPWQKFHVAMGALPKGFDSMVNIGLPKLYADAVVTTRTGVAGYMQRMLWDGKHTQMPVFVQEQMSADYSVPTVTMIDDKDLMARSMSYGICWPLFATDLEKKTAITACRRFLSASIVKQIDEKSPVFPHGISFAAVDAARKKAAGKKNRSFTLFFGGRLNALKRANQLISTYDKFYAAGRPIRIVLTSPLPTMPDAPREIEIYDSLNTEQFLEKCCKAHVLLASSRIEGFTAGLHEMMATGIVAILPDLDWAKVLLKEKWKTYPFKYRTFAEAYGLLKVIYEDYPKAQKQVAWMPDWLKANVTEADCSVRIYEWMAGIVDRGWPPKKFGSLTEPSGNGLLIEEMLQRIPVGKEFLLKEFMHMITSDPANQYEEKAWHLGSRGKFSAWQLYRYLSGRPDVVDCGGLHPRFKRVEEP